ncbi:MAG: divalent-cation tolerance protein CutA [Aquisalinus sp.]|nr:divalent-cation tolerance protein CutA [Aquisalinus sp.]
MSDVTLLYITVPNLETGAALAEKLVTARACACVNLLPGMRSVYEWQGKIEQAEEAVMIVKTTAAAADATQELIAAEHPYDCPCILALPVDAGASYPAFLDWIADMTEGHLAKD